MKKLYLSILVLVTMSSVAEESSYLDLNSDFEGLDINSILSSTRLKTSKRDTSFAISKISAMEIERFDYRNIPEALRYVPGITVHETHSNGAVYQVTYHGGNAGTPRRLNLLIDGVSWFQPGLSRINWMQLPVSMEDISSIEIIRGPAASLYGANSFSAVVNIITKKASESASNSNSLGFTTKVRAGDAGIKDRYLSWAKSFGETAVKISYSHQEDTGFDVTQENKNRHDGKRSDSFQVYADHSINDTDTINLTLSNSSVKQEEQWIQRDAQIGFPDHYNSTWSARLEYNVEINPAHIIKTFVSSRTSKGKQISKFRIPAILMSPDLLNLYSLNPRYANGLIAGLVQAPTIGTEIENNLAYKVMMQAYQLGNTMINTTSNLDIYEKQSDFEIQDTLRLSDDIRLVTGINYSEITGVSEWLVRGSHKFSLLRVFGNIEWQLNEEVGVNIGGLFEKDSISDNTFSPRLAVNYQLSPESTIRYSFSKAARTPDLFEEKADWGFDGEWEFVDSDVDGPLFGTTDELRYYVTAKAPGGLSPEYVFSHEIGFLYQSLEDDFTFDLRIFSENRKNLISEKLQLGDFNPSNNGYALIEGAEFEFAYQPTENIYIKSGYMFLDVDSVENEKTTTSKHVGFAQLSYLMGNNWSSTLSYSGYSKILSKTIKVKDGFKSPPAKNIIEGSIKKAFKVKDIDLSIALSAKHQLEELNFKEDNIYSERTHYKVIATLSF